MENVLMKGSDLALPRIALGAMRYDALSVEDLRVFIERAMELGMNFFDHADIYGGGRCEELFGEAIKGLDRKKMIIQSKCGIRQGFYDFSKEHILSSVDKSLERLSCGYLDILLLHRPDALMEPEVVAEVFDELYKSGKVHYFGVSNFKPSQIELLKKYCNVPLLIDQLQFSLPVSNMVASGLEVNMTSSGSFDHDGSVLDYCRLNDILVQAWSPFQGKDWSGSFIDSENHQELNKVMVELCCKYNCDKTALAAAWILRHPAKIEVVAGTTSLKRLESLNRAAEIVLNREDWYRLYLAAGHILP